MPTDDDKIDHPTTDAAPHKARHRRRMIVPAIALAALVAGAAGGAGAMKFVRPTAEMAPIAPVAISAMPASSLITIKGKVAEIYGNKFVLQDESGKALIETGPAGDNGKLVAQNEAITVQGRFDDGFVHAGFLVREDGRTEALRPKGPPPHGPHAELAPKLAP